MRIFEERRLDDYARPICVQQYKREAALVGEAADSIEAHRHDKRAAMKTLPPFERQA